MNDELSHGKFKYIKKEPIGGGKYRYYYSGDSIGGSKAAKYQKVSGNKNSQYGVYRNTKKGTVVVKRGNNLLNKTTKSGNVTTKSVGKIERGITSAKRKASKAVTGAAKSVKKGFEDTTGITARKQYKSATAKRKIAENDLKTNKYMRDKMSSKITRTTANKANADKAEKQAWNKYTKSVADRDSQKGAFNKIAKQFGVSRAVNNWSDAKQKASSAKKDLDKAKQEQRKYVNENKRLQTKKTNATAAEKKAKSTYDKTLLGKAENTMNDVKKNVKKNVKNAQKSVKQKVDKYRYDNPSVGDLKNDKTKFTIEKVRSKTKAGDTVNDIRVSATNEGGEAHKRLKQTIRDQDSTAKGYDYASKRYAKKATNSFSKKNYKKGLRYISKAAKSKARSTANKASSTVKKMKYKATTEKGKSTSRRDD